MAGVGGLVSVATWIGISYPTTTRSTMWCMRRGRWIAYLAWLLVGGTLIGLTAAAGPWVSAGLVVFFALSGSLLDLEYWGWPDTPRHR